MEYTEIIKQIFQICIFPILACLTGYIISFIKIKKNELIEKIQNENLKKYIELASSTVEKCVIATNQTYVESLKANGEFNKEAQKDAFMKTYDAVMLILTDEAKVYLANAFGDLNLYLENLIEANVNMAK